ncbi:MAG: phosphate regulon sensor histidine kinase PhoR [Xanthomonadales bacterium]|nr:phosphate regulon sensor histidine kinase PhoR [Xanthomonadales bacterium]
MIALPRLVLRALAVSLWALAGAAAVGTLVGLAAGVPWTGLTLGLLAWILYALIRLGRLAARLRSRRRSAPPEGWGVWGEIDRALWRRERDARARQRRLLAALRAFRDGARMLPDGVVVIDREDRILWCNRAAQRLLGLRDPADRGRLLTDLVRAPRLARWLGGERGEEPLLDLPSPADEQLRLGLRQVPLGDGRRMLIARDITQLMRLEQVRRDFVANVSHELRTPLTVIHGYLDLIDPEEHAELSEVLRELRQQSRRMTQLVEDLLTLSRLESEQQLPEAPIPIPALIEALRREADALSQGRHRIETEIACAHDLIGSPKDIHSAFSNLISNAVRYTPPGGRISIRWREEGPEARFEVEDTGVGIPPEHLPRITERFYRVSTSRSRETGGTGLGLSIVKHVLNLHQARLAIRSEPGRGSVFACIFSRERLCPRPAPKENLP